jgi:hypothetical protein
MAITVTEVQVEWDGDASTDDSISAAGNSTSDAFVINQACFQAQIELKAKNDGSPASGDTVDFYLQGTLGDPDGASASEYGSGTQDVHLATLDTYVNDPSICVRQLPMPLVGGKIYAVNNSAGRAITVSACILEQRG